jgi:hypothetical protein
MIPRRFGVVGGRRRRKTGVPKGYKHDWNYDGRWQEKKVRPGVWVGRFKAVKKRRVSAKQHPNSPGKGSVVQWKINGYQTATKISKNKYLTDFVFVKKLKKMKHRR